MCVFRTEGVYLGGETAAECFELIAGRLRVVCKVNILSDRKSCRFDSMENSRLLCLYLWGGLRVRDRFEYFTSIVDVCNYLNAELIFMSVFKSNLL